MCSVAKAAQKRAKTSKPLSPPCNSMIERRRSHAGQKKQRRRVMFQTRGAGGKFCGAMDFTEVFGTAGMGRRLQGIRAGMRESKVWVGCGHIRQFMNVVRGFQERRGGMRR